ncbi:uncharacterized protein CLUP02_16599 [Colletotrichum lupini]|uniref:Major facilitator superfamily (MFS) profile domain-containing protein n=1 Tax=Colletotrichum lupini TaxID=145971 RepID=A0A9Q8T8R0_9PEZI|nr:uncharacterized protein CLUP02_16599 [Colletotrichum lupini]UQC91065.1 hypothetical protein CLUP02_16599 [Colletotrichum lupini]
MAFYSFGTIMGPTLGPVLGGIVNGNLGWRWVFWLAAILAAVAAVGLLFWLPETHQPTIERLLTSEPHESHRNQQHHVRGLLARLPSFDNLRRSLCSAWLLPLKVASHLTCLVPLLMICVFNGTVNMILSSLGTVYQNHFGFPALTVGLSYLGIGFGGISALAFSKKLMQFVATKFPEDEDRKHASLLLLASGALLLPALGLLWYGWSVATHTSWIVPIIGLYFFGFGYMAVQLSLLIFVVESVPGFSGSAGAAFTVASSIGGSIIPLSTFPIYEKVGYGWGNTIIAGIEILLCAASMTMYLWTRKAGAQLPLKVHIHR